MYDGRAAALGGPPQKVSRVRAHMKKEKIEYPILFDSDGRVSKELGVRAHPTAFVIGRAGKVIWEGSLTAKHRATVQKRIEREMSRKAQPK